uniref:Transposase n=1 Tax=Globodera rostochiensis TaxID=31243 RepID=A0A914HQ35_GLORO
MEDFWILIFVAFFFATNSVDKAESVKVKLEPKTFDEIFGEGWWDKSEAEDLKTPSPTNFGQNVHNQIDRQNTQIGQIEPNSTDQLGEIEPNSTDQLGQIEHNSTDQLGQIEPNSTDQLGQIEPNSTDQNPPLIERKHLVEKFDQRKAELTRAGFKNSYKQEIDETVAKELGLSLATIYNWKSELGQTKPNKYPHSEQKELMKRYYEIKDQNPNIRDADIVKMLKIGSCTLIRWKKQFIRQQFHPNSVDGHSVEENAAANVQEIGHSNSGII